MSDFFEEEASILQAHSGVLAERKKTNIALPPAGDAATDVIDDDVDLVSALLGEFAGSFFVVLVTLGAVYASALVTFDVVTTDRALMIGLAYAFSYASCMYAFSFPAADTRQLPNMRHLNPAVTFALVMSFKIHIARAILYWMAQITGAGVAVLALYYFTPFEKKDVTTAYPIVDNVNFFHQWFVETAASYVSIFIILISCFGHLGKQPSVAAQIKETSPLTTHEINCTVVAAGIFMTNVFASAVSGGFMNPLMAIGIGILSGIYDLEAYIAPFIGAFLAMISGLLFGFKIKFMYFNKSK